jgi:hypothetical protein
VTGATNKNCPAASLIGQKMCGARDLVLFMRDTYHHVSFWLPKRLGDSFCNGSFRLPSSWGMLSTTCHFGHQVLDVVSAACHNGNNLVYPGVYQMFFGTFFLQDSSVTCYFDD